MGEPNRAHDPEKGLQQDEPRPISLSEGITPRISSVLTKAGEGCTNAWSKAGEGIVGAGSAMKEAGKKVGEGVGLGSHDEGQKKTYPKKKPKRDKREKRFQKGSKPRTREAPQDTNIVGNITKLLPANTFLMFQTLAPLSTNDGNCHGPEIIMTSIMLFILASTCMLVCFTDTIQFNGKVYHGLVTWSGLWNPSFKGDPAFIHLHTYELKLEQFHADRTQYKADKARARRHREALPPRPDELIKPEVPFIVGSTYSSGNSQYVLKFTDFLHAVLSVVAFATLTMFTNPVSTCFYPNIPSTVVKTLPLLVGFVISAIFAFSPPARNGIAHPLSPKVPSQTDNCKPPDSKGVKHDDDDDDDDSLTGSAKQNLGKVSGSSDHEDHSPSGHHGGMDGVKALANGFFSKYGDELKEGAAKVGHNLEGEMKKEASHLLSRAGPGVTQLSKELRVPSLAQIQESPHAEALMAGLMSVAGAGHPALAAAAQAAQSAYAQGAKDAVLQIHQDIRTATSAPLANSMLHSAGSTLSLPSAHDAHGALFHQAPQVLQRSGLASPSPHGSEATNIALATGQALMQAGFLPGSTLSPQAHALNAFGQGMGNLSLNPANALIKGTTSLVQQRGKSLADIRDELARQQSALTQGLNAQLQTLYNPDFAGFIHNGSQTLNQIQDLVAQQQAAISQGTFTTNLARQAGTLLLEGADHGIAGVQEELLRLKAAVVQRVDMQGQSISQPVSSLAQDVTSLALQGSQAMSNVNNDVMKQKDVLTQEVNTHVRALSTPAKSVAHDIAALGTPGSQGLVCDEASQKLIEGANSQFVESLAHGMARGMSMRMRAMAPVQEHISDVQQQMQSAYQPAASVAIDVAPMLQQGSQMHTQLARQQSASMVQRQASGLQPLQTPQQVVETHLRRLTSLPPQSPSQFGAALPSVTINTLVETRPVQQITEYSQRLRDNAGLTIEEVTDAGHGSLAMAPSASQVQTASSETVASTSEAAGQALATARARIWRERPESTVITDAISTEEITSESETDGRGDQFRAGSFSLRVHTAMKK